MEMITGGRRPSAFLSRGSPEAAAGGPLGLVQTGDDIVLDVPNLGHGAATISEATRIEFAITVRAGFTPPLVGCSEASAT